MKKNRTVLPYEERMKVIQRDNIYCFLCWILDKILTPANDMDHAFPLGNNGATIKNLLNQAWNINNLCRHHHMQSQWPDSPKTHAMRILLMQQALHRLYDMYAPKHPTVREIYKIYRSKIANLKSQNINFQEFIPGFEVIPGE